MRKTAFVTLAAALVFVAAGCPDSRQAAKPKVEKKTHSHPDKGPRGGALVEWGDEDYHLEFLVDHGKKQATIYVLDEDVVKAVPIAVKELVLTLDHVKPALQISMKAEPDKGDPEGKSSRFVAVHDELGKEMDFKGEISGKVGDKPFTGRLDEKGHAHKKK